MGVLNWNLRVLGFDFWFLNVIFVIFSALEPVVVFVNINSDKTLNHFLVYILALKELTFVLCLIPMF